MPTFEPMELIRVANALALVVGPGVLLARWLARDSDGLVRVALGVPYGVAIQVCGALALPIEDGPLRWLFVAAAWGAGIAAVAVAPGPAPARPGDARDRRADLALLGLLVVQGAVLIAIVSSWALPAGNDAVYHVAIADKLQSAGLWPADFLPYDPAAPNYPPGSHWLCAFVASVSGVAVHRVYALLMAMLLVALTASVAALARVWRGAWVGPFAAGAFALGAGWGGWDLLRWGSLPNLLGAVLMLGTAVALTGPSRGRSIALAAPLLAALVETHHLSALIFGVALVGAGVAARAVPGLARRFATRAAAAGAIAALLAARFFWLYGGLVASRLADPKAAAGAEVPGLPFLNVGEPAVAPWSWVTELGPLLWALAAVGVWERMRTKRPGPPGSEAAATADAFVLGSAAALGAVYLGLDWIARPIARAVSGIDLAILTPSRFLTDLVYPLSVLAGLGVARLAVWRPAAAWGAAVVGIGWSALQIGALMRVPTVPPDQLAAMLFVRDAAPADVLLLANPLWAPYVSGREGARVVLRQEPLTPYTARKRALLAGGSREIRAWMREHGRPVWVHATRTLTGPEVELVFERGRERLYAVVLEPGV